jgi:integrase/recombinase XerC
MDVPVQVLSAEEVERLLAYGDRDDPIGLRDVAVLATMFYAAATALEISNLNLGDLQSRRQQIVLRGADGMRRVDLAAELAQILELYEQSARRLILAQHGSSEQHTRALFLGSRPRRVRVQEVRQILGANVKGAGIGADVNVNTLRLSRAWHLREAGHSPESIQRFLGATSRSGRNVI